ncbi:TniQ family protein [Oceaniglobus ichthyenteri]|uniref:TniQ family protein n=1 Tax=Oceaniglobus ichthyenteri TaxID=2136177 RepID=UPI0013DE5715|nr:TniQ family protein [Oceaniglobus ichthyenteri]
MTHLPISNPPPAPRETVFSYLSRLAATWDTEVVEVAKDMGTSFKHFLEQAPEAFEALAAWAALKPQQLEEMLSWTGVRAGNVRMTFRDEVFVSRALRNPVMRGCPVCLREDAMQSDGPMAATMVLRGDWQMREANICLRHNHLLVALWTFENPRERYNIAARLSEIGCIILSGKYDLPAVEPTPYDIWLDGRLKDGRDDTWLSGHPLFAATTFCRLLGQAILSDKGADDDVPPGAHHAAAFEIAKQGEHAIRKSLARIAHACDAEPRKAYGSLFLRLNFEYVEEFAPYRRLLRDVILDNWPIAAGEDLLGEVVEVRRRNSLTTASQETGIGVETLEQFLVEAGALPGDDDRPPRRRLFDARKYADLLSAIRSLVAPIAMREAIGATKMELEAFEDEGLLVPRTRVAKVKKPWRISDGVDFVAGLCERAVPIAGNDPGWETLLVSRKRTRVSLRDQVEAIHDKRLTPGKLAGVRGLHGLVVRKSEVDRLRSSRPGGSRSTAENDADGGQPALMSAAEFGRSVGLRDHGNFISLIEAGHTPAVRQTNPKTGRQQYWLSAEDIACFHGRFVTLTTLSDETGRHRNNLKSLLKASRVARFAPGDQDFGAVFLREEAIAALQ